MEYQHVLPTYVILIWPIDGWLVMKNFSYDKILVIVPELPGQIFTIFRNSDDMKAKATNQVKNLNNKTPLESMMMKIEYLWLPQRDDQDESLSAIKSAGG